MSYQNDRSGRVEHASQGLGAVMPEMSGLLEPTEAESELVKAERAHDAWSREWDDADDDFKRAYWENGGRYKGMDPAIMKRRTAVGYKRRAATYRLKTAEFAAGLRSIRPCDPDDPECTDSPYYSAPG